ncbi:hypothetical protein Tco_1278127 [Tanacetum coccineum]
MAAYSTLNPTCTQPTKGSLWKLKISDGDSFRRSPNFNYICVPTPQERKQQIKSTIRTLPLYGHNVLVQFWAATKIGKTVLLTTTGQPFGLSGTNEELEVYRQGCLDHKLYVHPEKRIAVGLPGRVFLNSTPEQTQNVHNIPNDQRPPCVDAIFTRIWGSFAVPVIVDGQCVGVIDFVTDTPTHSYDSIIGKVHKALQQAGLQSSIKTDCPKTCVSLNSKIRIRRTQSFSLSYYFRLVPYFGLSSVVAAKELRLKKGTFRNTCRKAGIPEWPGIPSTNTRASSAPDQTRVNQTVSETRSVGTLQVDDSVSSRDDGISPTPIASPSENQINQTVSETSPNADDFNSCWDGGVYEGPLELFMPTNASATEAEINEIASDTSFTEALLNQHDGIEYPGYETMAIEDFHHYMFMESLDTIFEDAPQMIWAA